MPTLRVPAAGTLPTLRRYLNLTQTHLATLLGTTRGAVAQAEAGTRFLTVEARDALSALLAALPLATRQALAEAPGHAPPPLPPEVPAPPAPLPRPLARRRHLATQELDRVLVALAPLEARRLASAARRTLLAAPACPPALAQDALFAAQARLWAGSAPEAARRLLLARAAGLRAELEALAAPADEAGS
jgi:transcriptional regulator with XRE-family HTH domain